MSEVQQGGNSNLQKQDLSQLDVKKLHPLSPEVISRQATVNLGTIGHVAHGKSTIVKAISGVVTVRFKNELERNITIKLGENENEADVEFKNNSCDDRKRDSNSDIFSAIDNKPNSLAKSVRKQMTMLDYCKTDRSISVNVDHSNNDISKIELNSPVVEVKVLPEQTELNSLKSHDIRSSSSSPTNEANLIKTNCEKDSPSSIQSLNAVKSRKRSCEKSPSSSMEMPPKLRKKEQANENSKQKRKSVRKSLTVAPTVNNKKSNKQNGSNKGEKEEEIYVVESVVDVDVVEDAAHFFIKWRGYSAAKNTWEPLSHLGNCPGLITKFLVEEYEARKTSVDNILQRLDDNQIEVLADEEALLKLKDFDSVHVLTHLVLLAKIEESDDSGDESHDLIVKQLKQKSDTKMLPFWFKRHEQLKDLEGWQNEINKYDKSSQITVENIVDFEKSPSTFKYINDCVAGDGVVIPDDPLIGCDCKLGCSIKSNCCGKQLGSEYAYNAAKSIRLPQGNAVFECNKLCKCGPDCTNRVVQQGRKHSLTIFKTSNGRGWGVRTDRVIAKGQYICEYVGEIITNKEAEARGHVYDAEKRTYLFDLDCNSIVENKENLYTIDACKMGNVSRMINHSCDPNIGTWSVWINCLDLDIPKICFYALRRIEAGEELSFDYLNFSVHNADSKIEDDLSMSNIKTNFECRCNSEKCRKYIFDPSLLN